MSQFERSMNILSISKPKMTPVPRRNAHKIGVLHPRSMQGKVTQTILSMEVGQMVTIKYDGDLSNLRSRFTLFRKRYPDINITTRVTSDDTISVWRLS